MDDLPNDTPDVTVLLGEVQVPKLGGVLVEVGVGSEDSTRFPLGSDNSLLISVYVLSVCYVVDVCYDLHPFLQYNLMVQSSGTQLEITLLQPRTIGVIR